MLPWLIPSDPVEWFPPVDLALDEPNGLLALGGDLSVERLLAAYRRGIFPWYSEGQPVLWWSPDPRTVLFPGEMRISRSLRKRLRRGEYVVTHNRAFREVVEACRAPRPGQDGTWITDAMRDAYCRLHQAGWGHSFEVWAGAPGGELAGGLYGVAMGGVFFGESMFTRATDASKVALARLAGCGFDLIDCQLETSHLRSLGARPIPRAEFLERLARALSRPCPLQSPAPGATGDEAPESAVSGAHRPLPRPAPERLSGRESAQPGSPTGPAGKPLCPGERT